MEISTSTNFTTKQFQTDSTGTNFVPMAQKFVLVEIVLVETVLVETVLVGDPVYSPQCLKLYSKLDRN